MSAIKRFFEKKKLNSKFKLAGAGQQLNAPATKATPVRVAKPTNRYAASEAGSRAANAALSRFEDSKTQASKKPTSSAATWKHKSDLSPGSSKEEDPFAGSSSSVGKIKDTVPIEEGVMFCCPLCPVTLPREEIFGHLHQCFFNELDAEPLMISVTMIHTLNRDKQKVQNCIGVISKYLQNIIDNPSEPKYLKIRKTNKVFQEKVANMDGVNEFLAMGCGFEIQKLPFETGGETAEHEFYVMNETLAQDSEQLIAAKQMLSDAEPLEICIDRNIKVFQPSSSASHIHVPQAFYEMSADEIKQKQLDMSRDVEKSLQLRTKAMRQGETTPKRLYKYCIIRVRLPDGVLFQGTFSSVEKLIDLRKFIQECLVMDWLPFTVVDSIGRPYSDESATFTKLNLCPASLVNLNIESNIMQEIAASAPNGKIRYLRDEYMALMQTL